MPRGFLKHTSSRNAGISEKASRGGISRPKVKDLTCPCCRSYPERTSRTMRRRPPLLSIVEEGISDYYCSSDEEDFALYLDSDSVNSMDGFPGEETDHSFVAVTVSEINSISEETMSEYTFCGDEESSAFSILEGPSVVAGSAFVAGSNSKEDDQSYVVINTSDVASLLSTETPKKRPVVRDERACRPSSKLLCTICLEEKPLIHLMKNCRCHGSACKECLRTMYISHALDDPNRMYPLRCFWPDCDKTLRDVQIKKIAENCHEMEKYYKFEERQKHQRLEEAKRHHDLVAQERGLTQLLTAFRTFQSCPNCHHPASVRPYQTITDAETQVFCIQCSKIFQAEKLPREEVLAILAALGEEAAACPSCGAFFVKGGGCDDMKCLCGKEFSFRKARAQKGLERLNYSHR